MLNKINRYNAMTSFKMPEFIYNRCVLSKNKNAIDNAFLEFKNFFYTLSIMIDNNQLPVIEMDNEIVDEIWHLMLLDTKNYQWFSQQVTGQFIHHNPYPEKKEVVNLTDEKINLPLMIWNSIMEDDENENIINSNIFNNEQYIYENLQLKEFWKLNYITAFINLKYGIDENQNIFKRDKTVQGELPLGGKREYSGVNDFQNDNMNGKDKEIGLNEYIDYILSTSNLYYENKNYLLNLLKNIL